MRPVEEPTVDEYGHDRHPAFGVIGASRGSWSPPGAVLFDSDIRHQHVVSVRIKRARRRRDLNHDWVSGAEEIIEVVMSEAQWASFVSSMNTGDGVPCTIAHVGGEEAPGVPYAPRLAHSMSETRDAAKSAFDEIIEAMDAYEATLAAKAPALERREALAKLRARIRNATPNVVYAGESLTRHTEEVVTRARADIEAFVVAKAKQLGLEPADLDGGFPMLPSGDPDAPTGYCSDHGAYDPSGYCPGCVEEASQ